MSDQQADSAVRGERDGETLRQPPSVQSRVSNVLAIGLMSVLGLGMLTWYYANAITRQSRARQSVQAASAKRAQGDMPLRAWEGLIHRQPRPSGRRSRRINRRWPPCRRRRFARFLSRRAPSNAAYGAPPVKTAAQLELERQLLGAVFLPQSSSTPVSAPVSSPSPFPPGADLKEPGELSALIRPGVTTAVRAQVLPTQRLLLPKGAFLDCTLETAI